MKTIDTTMPPAIIGFSSLGSPCEQAWPSTHRALLPIAGQPVIVRLMQQLAARGIRHVRISAGSQQPSVRQRIRDGAEWGMTIRYSDLHTNDLRRQTLLEFGQCLYFAGDVLHAGQFDSRGNLGRPTQRRRIAADIDTCALWVLRNGDEHHFNLPAKRNDATRYLHLTDVASIHFAGVAAMSGLIHDINIPGRQTHASVWQDWGTEISKDALLGDGIVLGKHCYVGRGVKLHSDVHVGNGSVIRKDAQLKNVTLLPNTYVGPGVQLKDAVVTPIGIYDFNGHFWPIGDEGLIGRSRYNEEDRTGIPSARLCVTEQQLRA